MREFGGFGIKSEGVINCNTPPVLDGHRKPICRCQYCDKAIKYGQHVFWTLHTDVQRLEHGTAVPIPGWISLTCVNCERRLQKEAARKSHNRSIAQKKSKARKQKAESKSKGG